MSVGKKTGGRDWLPGQSGNPNGRPRVPDEIKAIRKLKRTEIEDKISEFMQLRDYQLEAVIVDPESTMIEIAIARIVKEAASSEKGDTWRLGFLLDRLIGTPKKTVALEGGEDGSNPIQLSTLTAEERAALIKVARGEKKES